MEEEHNLQKSNNKGIEAGLPHSYKRRASDRDSDMLHSFFNYALTLGKGASGLLSFGALYPYDDKSPSRHQFAFHGDEVRSLIRYTSEQGIQPDLVAETYKRLRLCEDLSQAPELDVPKLDEARVNLLKSYTELCYAARSNNGNVTGRTVRDSMQLGKHTARLVLMTFSFLFWGLLAEAMGVYFFTNPVPQDGIVKWIWHIYEYGLKILSPFFWGGLGACVYVLKRSYDASRDHAFDTETYGGWIIRVVLGFVLGGAVLYIIDPDTVRAGEVVIAFLTGLSTKVVYGALEKLILSISSKFDLDNARSPAKSKGTINEYLAQELSKLDPKRDKDKYKVLVQMLKDREGAPAG